MKKARRDNHDHESTRYVAERRSHEGCLKHKGRVSRDAAFSSA